MYTNNIRTESTRFLVNNYEFNRYTPIKFLKSGSFKINNAKIEVKSTDSLQEIATKINFNTHITGIEAKIAKNGSNYQLLLVSKKRIVNIEDYNGVLLNLYRLGKLGKDTNCSIRVIRDNTFGRDVILNYKYIKNIITRQHSSELLSGNNKAELAGLKPPVQAKAANELNSDKPNAEANEQVGFTNTLTPEENKEDSTPMRDIDLESLMDDKLEEQTASTERPLEEQIKELQKSLASKELELSKSGSSEEKEKVQKEIREINRKICEIQENLYKLHKDTLKQYEEKSSKLKEISDKFKVEREANQKNLEENAKELEKNKDLRLEKQKKGEGITEESLKKKVEEISIKLSLEGKVCIDDVLAEWAKVELNINNMCKARKQKIEVEGQLKDKESELRRARDELEIYSKATEQFESKIPVVDELPTQIEALKVRIQRLENKSEREQMEKDCDNLSKQCNDLKGNDLKEQKSELEKLQQILNKKELNEQDKLQREISKLETEHDEIKETLKKAVTEHNEASKLPINRTKVFNKIISNIAKDTSQQVSNEEAAKKEELTTDVSELTTHFNNYAESLSTANYSQKILECELDIKRLNRDQEIYKQQIKRCEDEQKKCEEKVKEYNQKLAQYNLFEKDVVRELF